MHTVHLAWHSGSGLPILGFLVQNSGFKSVHLALGTLAKQILCSWRCFYLDDMSMRNRSILVHLCFLQLKWWVGGICLVFNGLLSHPHPPQKPGGLCQKLLSRKVSFFLSNQKCLPEKLDLRQPAWLVVPFEQFGINCMSASHKPNLKSFFSGAQAACSGLLIAWPEPVANYYLRGPKSES